MDEKLDKLKTELKTELKNELKTEFKTEIEGLKELIDIDLEAGAKATGGAIATARNDQKIYNELLMGINKEVQHLRKVVDVLAPGSQRLGEPISALDTVHIDEIRGAVRNGARVALADVVRDDKSLADRVGMPKAGGPPDASAVMNGGGKKKKRKSRKKSKKRR